MQEQQAARRTRSDPHEEPISINISGNPLVVARILAGIVSSMEGGTPTPAAPAPLLVGRDEAARQTGVHRNRLSNLVAVGQLTNHGSGGKMLFSLAEIRAWQDRQR